MKLTCYFSIYKHKISEEKNKKKIPTHSFGSRLLRIVLVGLVLVTDIPFEQLYCGALNIWKRLLQVKAPTQILISRVYFDRSRANKMSDIKLYIYSIMEQVKSTIK